jgi:hypothetical protein
VKHRAIGRVPPNGYLREALLRQVESQPGLLGQRESPVHHSHRGEAQPFLPNLVRRARLNLTADLTARRSWASPSSRAASPNPADRPFASVRRQRDSRH